jgi:hypothetical protein
MGIDGRGTWDHAPIPRKIRTGGALLPLGDGLALIANFRRWPVPTFHVWTSHDGLRWRLVSRQRIWPAPRFSERRRHLIGFGSVAGRLVVTGTYESGPCCGATPSTLLAAKRGDARKRPPDDVTFALVSRDGKRFVRHRVKRIAEPARGLSPSRTGRGDPLDTWLAGGSIVLGSSKDGVTWRAIGQLPDELDPSSPFEVARTADGFVLVGEPIDGVVGPGDHLTIWHGSPKLTWTRVFDADHHSPDDIIAVKSTVILVGTRIDPADDDLDDPPYLPWVMASTDAGATWDPALGWSTDQVLCLGPLMAHRGVAVMGAQCPPEGLAALYAVDVDDAASVLDQ